MSMMTASPMLWAVSMSSFNSSGVPKREEAAKKLVKIVATEEPDPELTAKYEERYQKFRKLYPALKGMF